MYTDGSAKDGKAGSAVVVLLPDGGDEPSVLCTFMRRVLGAGTNGAAEVQAMSDAFRLGSQTKHLEICGDSTYALGL